VAAHERCGALAARVERDVLHLDAGRLLEEIGEDVVLGVGAGAGDGELARARLGVLTNSSTVWYFDSVRTDSISSSMATIMSIDMSRWLPGRRPSILADTIVGAAPAITWGSPFLFKRYV
jgi:hypothetical protein